MVRFVVVDEKEVDVMKACMLAIGLPDCSAR